MSGVWDSWMAVGELRPTGSVKAVVPEEEDALLKAREERALAARDANKWRTIALRLAKSHRERYGRWRASLAEVHNDLTRAQADLRKVRDELRQLRKDYADLQAKKNPPKKAPPKRKPVSETLAKVFEEATKNDPSVD